MEASDAQATVEAALEPPGDERAPFSLELSDDQRDVRDWVHGFAEGVVRPAAAEWDEREETPWPIIQEAAKIGLYHFEAIAQFWAVTILAGFLCFFRLGSRAMWQDEGETAVLAQSVLRSGIPLARVGVIRPVGDHAGEFEAGSFLRGGGKRQDD